MATVEMVQAGRRLRARPRGEPLARSKSTAQEFQDGNCDKISCDSLTLPTKIEDSSQT